VNAGVTNLVAGLILAGGASRRMGAPKALLQYSGETFLDRLIGLFAAVCDPVIVVLGSTPEVIRGGLQRTEQARFLVNEQWMFGQLTSMQKGLAAAPPEAGVLFTPVDYPAVSGATVARVVEAYRAAPGCTFAAPVFGGRRGHPVCIAPAVAREILALPPEAQARDVIRARAEGAVYVEVDDPGILTDVDDPEAYQRLLDGRAP
jgi:CTP:molybdopterin cytidylyltransferase MocA